MIKSLLVILLLTVLLSFVGFGQGNWEKIKTPTDFNLLKVCYFDSLHCWVAGDSGVIMFSSDQGLTWEVQNSGVSNYIQDIFFLNDSIGWALTFEIEGSNNDIRSKLLKTTDSGLNWNINNYRHLNIILNTIYFVNSTNGWIGGMPFALAFTTTGGDEWLDATIDSGTLPYFPVNQIRFNSDNYGFACGGAIDVASVIWRSTNGGKNWVSSGIQADPFFDFQFLDTSNIISLAGDRERFYPIGKLKTYGNGTFWNYDTIPFYGEVSSIEFRTQNELWATFLGDHIFLISSDTGNTWASFPMQDSLNVFDIDFADSLHGIAVGEAGYIFRYLPDSVVSVNEQQTQVPNKFMLEQNYPNPFNPSTKISWQFPAGSWQTLKVYDILGNEVASLVNEYRPAGSYEIEFNPESSIKHPASGIYFYRLVSGSYSETKKMLLLK